MFFFIEHKYINHSKTITSLCHHYLLDENYVPLYQCEIEDCQNAIGNKYVIKAENRNRRKYAKFGQCTETLVPLGATGGSSP